MASTYRPNESKREEFRRYLEKGGVVDAITRSFCISPSLTTAIFFIFSRSFSCSLRRSRKAE
jgi:hypothetical protein